MSGRSNFPKFFTKPPMGRFFLEKIFKRVAYKKIKFKDGIDMEVYGNLDFVNFDGHVPCNPATLENESQGSFEELVGRD